MATISNDPKPAYAYDAETATWYPVGTGAHTHTASGVGAVATSSFAAKGDLLVGTGAGTLVAQSVGANGTVLTADSTQADGVIWAAPAAGGMTLLSTINASAATSLSFTSISADYTNLVLTWEKVYQTTTDSAYWSMRLNNDTTADNHVINGLYWAGSATGTGATATSFGNNFANAPIIGAFNGSDLYGYNCYGAAVIYNYSDAARGTFGNYTSTARGDAGGYRWNNIDFVYEGTSAISRIDFIRSGSQSITGTFRLYGVK